MGLEDLLESYTALRTFTYPICVDRYRTNWDDWDIARELISNALDAEEGRWENVKMDYSDGCFRVYNSTRSLDIKDFYIGYSSQGKDLSTSYIGRFNEGLKIAMMVALRNLYSVIVSFKDYIAIPSILTTEDGIDVMSLEIFKSTRKIEGTLVEVDNVRNDISRIIEKNIIKPGDSRILHSVKNNNMILNKKLESILTSEDEVFLQPVNADGIFVGGMYISSSAGYAWGYNFAPSTLRISEGRNLFDYDELDNVLSESMQFIESKDYWRGVFEAIKNHKEPAEADLFAFFYAASNNMKSLASQAWSEVFGEDSVVEDSLSREAEYRGANIVPKRRLLERMAAAGIIPGGKSFLLKYSNMNRIEYTEDRMSERESKAYRILRKITGVYAPTKRLLVYSSYDEKLGAEKGFYDQNTGTIGINISAFRSAEDLIDVLIEELTHAIYNTSDMTREHVDKLRGLSSKMLLDESLMKTARKLRGIYNGH